MDHLDAPSAPQPRPDTDWPPSGGAGGQEPELVDLRLHMPRTDVVVVRVSGTLDGVNAQLLGQRVGQQLRRAPHVVVDLSEVRVLGAQGLTVLLALHRQASERGVELHIVSVERAALCRSLHASGLAQLVQLESTVDAVIAGLPWPGHVPRQRVPHQS